jgi:hypothetical protein
MRTCLALAPVAGLGAIPLGCVSGKCDCPGAECAACSGIPNYLPVLDGGQVNVDAESD